MSEPAPGGRCPVCKKPMAEPFRPFCSKRCADVDLNRWLSGVYVVQAAEDDDEADAAGEPGGRPH
jgi:endogenous inhibitor of DNA gyrase (YacG/DUF329 family)